MVIATFVITRTWKQPRCPLTKENVVHLHHRILHSGKNNDILKFAGKWMDLENKTILSEVTQIQKDKYISYSLISSFYT